MSISLALASRCPKCPSVASRIRATARKAAPRRSQAYFNMKFITQTGRVTGDGNRRRVPTGAALIYQAINGLPRTSSSLRGPERREFLDHLAPAAETRIWSDSAIILRQVRGDHDHCLSLVGDPVDQLANLRRWPRRRRCKVGSSIVTISSRSPDRRGPDDHPSAGWLRRPARPASSPSPR